MCEHVRGQSALRLKKAQLEVLGEMNWIWGDWQRGRILGLSQRLKSEKPKSRQCKWKRSGECHENGLFAPSACSLLPPLYSEPDLHRQEVGKPGSGTPDTTRETGGCRARAVHVLLSSDGNQDCAGSQEMSLLEHLSSSFQPGLPMSSREILGVVRCLERAPLEQLLLLLLSISGKGKTCEFSQSDGHPQRLPHRTVGSQVLAWSCSWVLRWPRALPGQGNPSQGSPRRGFGETLCFLVRGVPALPLPAHLAFFF